MNQYTTYCTTEQTRNALELGAPIRFASINDIRLGRYIEVESNNKVYEIPTTEQMIGWLEEQEEILGICKRRDYGWFYQISIKNAPSNFSATFHSRKEVTIAAIDAAMEYLKNK